MGGGNEARSEGKAGRGATGGWKTTSDEAKLTSFKEKRR
jgi:hypothetical protein